MFVGQESGGSALCYDGSRNLELPHTGLRLRVATLPFLAAGCEALIDKGIVPDYPVFPNVDDLVAGRDTVLAGSEPVRDPTFLTRSPRPAGWPTWTRH